MGDVVKFRGKKSLEMTADEVLQSAVGNVSDVFVIGYDKNGDAYFSASTGDGGDLLWLIEIFKKRLMNGDLES